MRQKTIVGISGKARVGKDTAAQVFIAKGYTSLAFADGIKHLATVCGWDGKKDEKGRKFLQELGRVIREYNPNFLVNIMIDRIEKSSSDRIVITDCRFKNEADWLKTAGNLIRIERPNNPEALTGSAAEHVSEVDLDDYPFELVIQNDSTISKLHEKISNVRIE